MFFFFEISMPYTKELFDNDEKKNDGNTKVDIAPALYF
jgi:hypothetical protein